MDTEPEPIFIIATGASTPVGRDSASSAAAVRAGVSGFTEHPFLKDSAGEPMRVALAPWLDIGLTGVERLEALLFPAVDEALLPIIEGAQNGVPRIALALGLPDARPGLVNDVATAFNEAIRAKYGHLFSAVALFPDGHAAGLLALDAAARKLTQGAFDACIVAGVDSYIDRETLEWLEENEQLHGAGILNNAWGFIPGEGAGALLIMRRDGSRTRHLTPLARVLDVGTALEANKIKTDTVCIGEGLTQALRGALASLPAGLKVTDVYCDLNGEPYRADEYGFSALRTKESFESASDFVSPADCWGDVSAAGAPLHVMLAVTAGLKQYSNGKLACIWASSEGGERAAVVTVVDRSA